MQRCIRCGERLIESRELGADHASCSNPWCPVVPRCEVCGSKGRLYAAGELPRRAKCSNPACGNVWAP